MRRLEADELARNLAWLRDAVRDPNLPTRVVLDGILDVLTTLADLVPGPPAGPGPPP